LQTVGFMTCYYKAAFASLIPKASRATHSTCSLLRTGMTRPSWSEQGHETSFFALLNLVERAGAIMSPLTIGVLIDLTGKIQVGFGVSLALILVSMPLLRSMDLDQGYKEAQEWLEAESPHQVLVEA
jgi:hypothetical protein